MTDLRYNKMIEVGVDGGLIEPPIILCTRSGKKLGIINNVQNLVGNHPMNGASEISFDVYKEVDGIKNPIWDLIKNFKFVFFPTITDARYQWYEIVVNIDEENDTVKHITGLHANEAELGQLMLYEVEINTPEDINRDDYEIIKIDGKEYGTVFYNPTHPKASLLHRILSDKASHYEIIHVDETLKNLQREFSFNGTSIVDALTQTIAQEIGCLFVFGLAPNNENDGSFHRTISAYDLMDYCEDCEERGVYTQGVCTHCGGTNIISGYGKDTGIFINAENLAESITLNANTDEVKNFFKMSAGDEDMNAAIRNCNPNGSDYLFLFTDEMKEDMSDELRERLNEYDEIYDAYLTDEIISLPVADVNNYNDLIEAYQEITEEDLVLFESSITGFSTLTEYDYNSLYFKNLLQTVLMPASSEIVETTAQEQINKLTTSSMSPIGVEKSSSMSLTAANTAVKSYAEVYIDTSRYRVEINNSSYAVSRWTGTITVTSLTKETDTANKQLTIIFNNNLDTFLKQKIEKLMKEREAEDIGDVSFLQTDITQPESEEEFSNQLHYYSLDALNLLDQICVSVLDILTQAGQGNEKAEYYDEFYLQYLNKRRMIISEERLRESEIKIINTMITDIDTERKSIIDYLDMESFFGEQLYSELMLYRRETDYSNNNFISDGMSDSEIISNAKEFFKRAREEIVKAANVQYSISTTLHNLFLIPEFRQLFEVLSVEDVPKESDVLIVEDGALIDGSAIVNIKPEIHYVSLKKFINLFDSGNWLRIKVDDNIYKLRLTNWELDYSKPEELEVEFSDAVRVGNIVDDVASVLSQARTMATTYDALMRQAEKGFVANKTIQATRKQGIVLNQNKIVNSARDQTFIINSEGLLARGKNDFDDDYSSEQVKLLNKGIYYTNDDWETVKAGLGHFIYYDPVTGTTKEDYGLIASTVIGQLFLGENLEIYSEAGNLKMNQDGLTLTSIEGADNTNLFCVQKLITDEDTGESYVEKYIYVDSEGNVKIAGNTVSISGQPLVEYVQTVTNNSADETRTYIDQTKRDLEGYVDSQISDTVTDIDKAMDEKVENAVNVFVGDLSTVSETVDGIRKWVTANTTEDNPYLMLGTDNSPIYAVLTNDRLEFRLRGAEDPIAYIGTQTVGGQKIGKLFVTNSVVEDKMQFGNWAWYQRENGNMSIKWIDD